MIERTAHVARTAHDLDHVNKLVIPTFGIRRLALVASGGQASKTHLPLGAPAPAAAGAGSDDFHFCPEKEVIQIQYDIEDKFGVVESARLQLFTRFEEKPIFDLDLTPLGRDWWSHGKHSVKWDGRIVKPTAAQKATLNGDVAENDLTALAPDKTNAARYPDGYVTLEFTPYKLKMVLKGSEGRGFPEVAWTYYHILLKSIELELGPEDAIPAATLNDPRHLRDKRVWKKISIDGGVPPAGTTRKVMLLSNVYKTSLAEMNTDAGHIEYRNLWLDGPRIPLIAKIRLLDSADAEVKLETDKGAVALGHAKFLWDWEDPDEAVAAQIPPATPQGFVKNAIDYYKSGADPTRAAKDHTYPKGDNCHVDHGGKRGPDSLPIFLPQPGYPPAAKLTPGKFPFKVVTCTTRKWAALSEGWGSGELKGRTGALFNPSRMAGDDYQISVYLAYDKESKGKLRLDAITEPLDPPPQIKSAPIGLFQVWREVHLGRYIRKLSSIGAFLPGGLAGIQNHFNMAYIEVQNRMGTTQSYSFSAHRKKDGSVPDYNTLVRKRLKDHGNVIITDELAVDPAANHAADESMFRVRSYHGFVVALHEDLHSGKGGEVATRAAALSMTPLAFANALGTMNLTTWPNNSQKTRFTETKTWMVTRGIETDAKYCQRLDDIGIGIGDPFAADLELIKGGPTGVGEAPQGVTTFHFNYTNSHLRVRNGAGAGYRFWYGSAIDLTEAGRSRCAIMFWVPGVDRFSHEYGHHVFLPHAKYPLPPGIQPGGFQVNRHDDTDSGCLMSYSPGRPAFCGLCLLRLRGWSATKLDKTSANNKKP